VAPGRTVGIDRSAEVIAQAKAQAGTASVSFATGDVYALAFDDESFDVVHTHQMLQHLTDPVAALRQMRRVLRPGGTLAARDSDYGGFVWAPGDALLDRWMQLYHQVCARNGADADAGRELPGWVRAAGFRDLTVSSSTWTFSSAEDRAWWGGLWADRVVESAFAEQAVGYGLVSSGELSAISSAWRRWADRDDGVFIVLHAEVLARR
jgi:SAM-dependent methyltransferase